MGARLRRFRATIASLSGHADERLVAFLLGQLDATARGVDLARSVVTGSVRPDTAHELMSDIEHDGDVQRGLLVDALSGALGTSIDREDLFRLSRAIDDVLDGLRDFVREFALYQVAGSTVFTEFIDEVASAVRALRVAVSGIAAAPGRRGDDVLAAKKAASGLRRQYQNAMAAVLGAAVSPTEMKVVELMRRLDVVGACLGNAADALADGALKRWH